MKTTRKENTTTGSFEIHEQGSEGIAGPSREMSRTGAATQRTDGAGYENNNDEYDGEDRPFNPVLDVIRKTELLGWDLGPAHHKRRKIPVIDPDDDPDNPEEE